MTVRTAFPRLTLLIVGVILTVVGITLGFSPEKAIGMSLGHRAATTHMRVSAGGFHLGVGLYCLLGAARSALTKPSLIAGFLILSCVIGFRLMGLVVDAPSAENFAALGREGFAFCLLAVTLVAVSFPHWRDRLAAEKPGIGRVAAALPNIALAALSLFAGVTGCIELLTGVVLFTPPMSEDMHRFIDPLMAFTPVWGAVKVVQTGAGAALLSKRWGPSGALLLAPLTLVIVLSQVLLNGPRGVGVGILIAALQGWCLWIYRDRYRAIVSF